MCPASSAPAGGFPDATWSRQQPRLAVAVIAGLFVGVFALRVLQWNSPNAYSLLYVLPVALAATAFGRRGGVLASVVAVLLLVAVAPLRESTPDAGGWLTRVVPILLLGVLLGYATDRARAAEAERRRLEVAALLHREAIEINDSLVQRMTVAKWSLESGNADAGLEALTEAMTEAHRLVSGLIRQADMGGRSTQVPGLPEA